MTHTPIVRAEGLKLFPQRSVADRVATRLAPRPASSGHEKRAPAKTQLAHGFSPSVSAGDRATTTPLTTQFVRLVRLALTTPLPPLCKGGRMLAQASLSPLV